MNRMNNLSLSFFKGLLFVGMAYLLIKVIDHYEVLFNGINGMLATIWPFLLAFVLAYAFNPIIVFLEKKFKCQRTVSIAVTYIGLLLFCYLGASFLFPVIYQSSKDLVSQIPGFASEIQIWLTNWTIQIKQIDVGDLAAIQDQILRIIPKLTDVLTNSLTSVIGVMYHALMGTSNVLLAFIISIYVLLEKEKFSSITRKLVSIICRPKLATHVFHMAHLFHSNIGKYLIGKSIDSLFVGICAVVGLSLMGAKYALLLGVIFGITNMIPFIGPIFGTLIAVGINFFYSPFVALMILVFLLIVQQVETLIIDPKVVGQKMGLNPFLTLLAVTIGGKFMGMIGMILGVPIMGVIKLYFTQFIDQEYEKLYLSPQKQKEESVEEAV